MTSHEKKLRRAESSSGRAVVIRTSTDLMMVSLTPKTYILIIREKQDGVLQTTSENG
jgi:hypothetical protein